MYSVQVAEDYADVHLGTHLLRLRACKKLLMAVYIATGIQDESLACKAGLRAYNLLLPLLQLRRPPGFLFQAYAVVHSALRVFLTQEHVAGEESRVRSGVEHPEVRRVLCCISHAIVTCAKNLDEPELLKSVLDTEFEDQERVLISAAQEGGDGVLTFEGVCKEQHAIWEYLLGLPELQDKAKGYAGKLKSMATEVSGPLL